MSGADNIAQQALIAFANVLALEVVQGPNHKVMTDSLARLLPGCKNCPPEMLGVRSAVTNYLVSQDHKARQAAQIRLFQELRRYHLQAGGALMEALRKEVKGRR